ncbi:MAG: peptidoglycan -binding protein [Acetobacterales bacterium]
MSIASRSRRDNNIWPGFVDALATLLMVLIFLLLVFVMAQVFLNEALLGRDAALDRLNNRIDELAEMLALERETSADLRLNVTQLSAQLQETTETRDQLQSRFSTLQETLSEVRSDRDRISAELARLRSEQESLGDQRSSLLTERQSLQDERNTLLEQRQQMSARLADLESEREQLDQERNRLAEEVVALRALRDDLEQEVGKLASQLDDSADAREGLEKLLQEERSVSETARARIAMLNDQVAALRQQIAQLNAALETAEKEVEQKDIQIANLGQRLNAALATRVQQLARYRSEFFGRLREVLGNRPGIRIVGDRFVFQSEVLFETGEAVLQPGGREQINQLADTLLEISREIPADVDWILRVDGHTDKRPISTLRFPSNWELSTGRSVDVVKALIERGVPADRLLAAGFGEYHPIDDRNDEIALRRNRRIEFKLTTP